MQAEDVPCAPEASRTEFGSIPAILSRRARLIVLVVLLLAGALALGYQGIPCRSRATALIGVGALHAGGMPMVKGEFIPLDLSPLSLSQLTYTSGTVNALRRKLGGQGGLMDGASMDAVVGRGVDVVQIDCSHPQSSAATLIANTLCETLLERNREFLRRQTKIAVAQQATRLERERKVVAGLEAELRGMRTKHDVHFLEQQVQTAFREVAVIERRLVALRRDRAAKEKGDQDVKPGPAPVVPSGEEASGIAATTALKIKKLLAERSELLLTMQVGHPQIRLIDRQVDRLLKRMQSDASREPVALPDAPPVVATAGTDVVAEVQGEIVLLERAKGKWDARLEELSTVSGTLRRLEMAWKARVAVIDHQEARLIDLRERADQPEGRFEVVEWATDSGAPSPVIPTAVAVIIWGFLALLAAAIIVSRDLVQRRVITAEDAGKTLGMPAFDTSGAGRSDTARDRIYDRIARHVRTVSPDLETLVVTGIEPQDGVADVWAQITLAFRRLAFDNPDAALPRVRVDRAPDLASVGRGTTVEENDGVILVARTGRFRSRELSEWADVCPGGRSNVLGCVMTSGSRPDGARLARSRRTQRAYPAMESLRPSESCQPTESTESPQPTEKTPV